MGSSDGGRLTTDTEGEKRSPGGPFFWAMFLTGWAVLLFGAWTMLREPDRTKPLYSFALALGSNIAHDALLAPVVCLVGIALARLSPRSMRAPITLGLFATGVVLAIAYAPLRGLGLREDNPTVLPLNYTTATLTVLGVVWALVAGWSAIRIIRGRSQASPA